ncbi:hypothetical protein [Sporosarcina sp. YIM B06819]|uniref:hypothetical protein n=1 Tax=Sporosarcina sp. YIM B06819 TaxID=3081769 RepID=UPI00298BFE94|nr:hypothetical protein [Sporosarcina sp. YIM B06819]
MRKWRVGTVSMGLSLVLLGVFLFLAQIIGTKMFEPFLVWWPIILVVLGIEIIVYLLLSKQENPIVKYDFISIFFVGLLGTIGIGFTILTSSGLLTELQTLMVAEDKSFNLPAIEEELPDNIKRVVLETGEHEVNIEGSDVNQLTIFGTYRARVNPKSDPVLADKDDYTLTKIVGYTMYVTIKATSRHSGPFSTYLTIEPTIIVPDSVRLEVRGERNTIALYPGSLKNHWTVDGPSYATMHVGKNNDVLLSATSRNNLQNGNVKWDSIETPDQGGDGKLYKGTLKIGNGTFYLDILNSERISVNLVEGM